MSARKPKIEYYWWRTCIDHACDVHGEWRVNWRLVGANGEIMCQSTQGFRDKADARRSVDAVASVFFGVPDAHHEVREVGPGRNPAALRHAGKGK